jgi:hypothetical protein
MNIKQKDLIIVKRAADLIHDKNMLLFICLKLGVTKEKINYILNNLDKWGMGENGTNKQKLQRKLRN